MSSFVKASGGLTPNSADPGEEFPFLHTITVVDRVVSVDKPELVQNNIKTETVTLNLDSEWEGLSTVINIGNEKPVSVIWSGEPVVIPAELMTTVGSLDVSVVGYGDDRGIRAVTKQAQSVFNVVASGFVEGDEAVPDPTTVLGQLVQAADNANQAADRFNQASEDIEGIGPAIEKVHTSEVNAKQSETNAAASAESASQSASQASTSAQAARTSETNAATSASSASEASTAAKASETNAASSATAASQSASQAQSSATAAASSAQAASTSAESAKTASDSVTSSKDAAAQSASEASASAHAAKASETNAASSASSAKISETNAAASATAAQQAVDGFGLEVGTTTTGEPGSDASVEIKKTGTKYTANFTIPRGEPGVGGSENVLVRTASGTVSAANDSYSAPRQIRVHGETINNLVNEFSQSDDIATYSYADGTLHCVVKPGSGYPLACLMHPEVGKTYTVALEKDISPFYVKWEDTKISNGVHTVVHQGKYQSNNVLIQVDVPDKSYDVTSKLTIVEGSVPPSAFTPSGITTAKPEKLIVHTNNFFPNIPVNTQNGITLTQDANGIYHMDGVATEAGMAVWKVSASVPSGDYVFKHSASRSRIDGYVSVQNVGTVSSTTGTKVSVTGSGPYWFSIRYSGLQQGVEYHDTFQIVLASGTDIPSDFPKNESSEVALPSDLNLTDGDTLVIDSDGSTRITHSSGDPTPSTPVTLPAIPAPTFAIYTEGGLTHPTVDVDYERDINIVVNKLEQAMAVQAATMKVNQLTD